MSWENAGIVGRRCFHSLALLAAVMVLPLGSRCLADSFTRGDVNQSGRIEITDAVLLLEKLFRGGDPLSCEDSADVDDDGSLTVSDPISLLGGLFRGGSSPAAPFPECGEDPTEDDLSCGAFEACMFTFEYYDRELSGDAVIFLLDRSFPLGTHANFSKFKGEIERVVESMPDGVRFAMLFFDAGFIQFPSTDQPAIASDETRASAAALVRQIPSGTGTCGDKALLRSLDLARLTGARRNLILYASNGGGTCMGLDEAAYLDRSLEEVTLANSGLARIHTFGIFLSVEVERNFLVSLAERNGGTFTVVSEQ